MVITAAKHARFGGFITEANYLPWMTDDSFNDVYSKIKPNTMVDIYRCYELWTLVEQAAKLPGDILEIGVWRGGTGCLMAKRAQLIYSDAKVYLCDTFRGVIKVSDRDPHYQEGWHATPKDHVDTLIAQLEITNARVLSGIFPDETGHMLKDRKISLCHIDVDIYLSALHIVEWVWPRMPIGGILVFDDYGFAAHDGITDLVNERAHLPGTLTLYNLNGHGLVIKTGDGA
jgi:O-methyltransferase